MTHYKEKGLYTALDLSREMQVRLVVAGSANNAEIIKRVSELCDAYGAKYVGDVRGTEKAELFAYARALIFPTEWDECCPLIIAESLISGTPVIVSNNAACAEMVSPEVGFVCADERDYTNALESIEAISTRACRDYAFEKYHYLRMTEAYLKEYEAEIME
jgi:glycosyltransferase involved in cell wall biosynthesis